MTRRMTPRPNRSVGGLRNGQCPPYETPSLVAINRILIRPGLASGTRLACGARDQSRGRKPTEHVAARNPRPRHRRPDTGLAPDAPMGTPNANHVLRPGFGKRGSASTASFRDRDSSAITHNPSNDRFSANLRQMLITPAPQPQSNSIPQKAMPPSL